MVQEWELGVPNGYMQLVFVSVHTDSCAIWSNTIPYFFCNCSDWVEVSYGNYSEKFCSNGGGKITTNGNSDYDDSHSTIPTFSSTEPITVRMHTDGVGGSKGFRAFWMDTSPDFFWVGDNSMVDGSNWAHGFPVSG